MVVVVSKHPIDVRRVDSAVKIPHMRSGDRNGGNVDVYGTGIQEAGDCFTQ
jgi:hypothetical protein